MSSTYRPDTASREFTPQQQDWLRRSFSEIKRAWEDAKPSERFQTLHAAPAKTFGGMVVNADGTDWDPGSGAGLYLRDEANTEWVFLGAEAAEAEAESDIDFQILVAVQTEQLRQLSKIAMILSAVTGIVIEDGDVRICTGQLQAITNISLMLSAMTGITVDSDTVTLS